MGSDIFERGWEGEARGRTGWDGLACGEGDRRSIGKTEIGEVYEKGGETKGDEI
jgi:hypothetical protein